jgi:hypothetical protein
MWVLFLHCLLTRSFNLSSTTFFVNVLKSSSDIICFLFRPTNDIHSIHQQKNSNAALSLSDMDATYFELEQAALERSLQSYSQNENEKKQRASTSTSSSSSSCCTTSNKSNSSSSSSKHQIIQGGDHKAPAVASAAAASLSSTNSHQAAAMSVSMIRFIEICLSSIYFFLSRGLTFHSINNIL